MNCKPGDMAIIVGAEKGDGAAGVAGRLCIGRIVRVAILCSDGVWDFEKEINLGRIHFKVDGQPAFANVEVLGLHDRYLLPISGVPVHDEVTDETTA